MKYKNLTQEQMDRAKGLQTPEEVLEFAKAEGIEISDDQLEAISGGGSWNSLEEECNANFDPEYR